MGKEGDATPFTSVTVDNISAALHRCVLGGEVGGSAGYGGVESCATRCQVSLGS